jgi:hypothetical protein
VENQKRKERQKLVVGLWNEYNANCEMCANMKRVIDKPRIEKKRKSE